MASPSPSPSPKPSFRSRMGSTMRRSSTGLGSHLETPKISDMTRWPYPRRTLKVSETSLSDASYSTRESNLKVGTTLPESPPYTIVSAVAESPAREMASEDKSAMAQEIAAPNIEAKDDVDLPKVSTNLSPDENNDNGSGEHVNGPLEVVDENYARVPPSVPPLALIKRIPREEIVNEILDLTNH